MWIALTHLPSPQMNSCELTHIQRKPIDIKRAISQHANYCRTLQECGLSVLQLVVNQDYPDSVFIEDTAIVLDEIAILTSMGAESRRSELPGIAARLYPYRPVATIEPPAHIEGGDVLRVGRTLYVGLSSRTNEAGIEALRAIIEPLDYRLIPIPLEGALHLKTACTALDDETVLINPQWINRKHLSGFEILTVHPQEPWAANVLRLPSALVIQSGVVRTIQMLNDNGYAPVPVDISEFLKAEAGLTCMSLVFEN